MSRGDCRCAIGRAARILIGLALGCSVSVVAAASDSDSSTEAGSLEGHALGLPEESTPLETLPDRPRPLVELGNGFLEPTRISEGWTIPTGAVWQPSFLVWGTARSAVQAETGGGLDQAQWANRLDLFGQLSLTPTERFVVSLEPFQGGSEFTGYRFGLDGVGGEFVSDFNFSPNTLFFEGDFGEIFPHLQRRLTTPLDLGFMVGRVPIVFQDGFLIDDRMTAFGLVQNSILVRGTSNFRVSLITAWDGVHRGNNASGGDSLLTGVFTEFDRSATTWSMDAVYVKGDDGANGVFAGVSTIRRFKGRWNLSSRLLGSYALTDSNSEEVADGLLAVLGLSFAPRGSHHNVYFNGVLAAGHYTAAARAERIGAGRWGGVGFSSRPPVWGPLDHP